MEFIQENSLYYYIPKYEKRITHVMGFDLDWTLSYGEQHLYPRNEEDIHILPRRKNLLHKLYNEKGIGLIIFTNQFAKSKKEKLNRIARVKTFLKKIGVPVSVFIATEKDKYRKPESGMWEKMTELLGDVKVLAYVGDALGRPQDFSDSDKLFAEKKGVKIYSPEQFFRKQKLPEFQYAKEIVIFVGAPGTGKTTFYREHLQPLGYVHVNQDTLKTASKIKKVAKEAVENYEPLCIDSTNPTVEKRQIFFDLAAEFGYNVTVLYFVRDGYGWNKLREKPVPAIAYHMFYKNLEPPTKENSPGRIFKIL